MSDTDFAAELQKLQTALYSGRTADFDAARFMDVFARVGKRQKKKKAKVRTLTDEQYNDYLMALKDERPTMLIDENGKRRPQK